METLNSELIKSRYILSNIMFYAKNLRDKYNNTNNFSSININNGFTTYKSKWTPLSPYISRGIIGIPHYHNVERFSNILYRKIATHYDFNYSFKTKEIVQYGYIASENIPSLPLLYTILFDNESFAINDPSYQNAAQSVFTDLFRIVCTYNFMTNPKFSKYRNKLFKFIIDPLTQVGVAITVCNQTTMNNIVFSGNYDFVADTLKTDVNE